MCDMSHVEIYPIYFMDTQIYSKYLCLGTIICVCHILCFIFIIPKKIKLF